MSTGGCTVLIVDDDADTREALSTALSEAGFHVEISPGAAEALRAVQRKQPDVILLDLRMPGMGGAQFLEQIPALRSKVIVLTADSSARLLRFAREAKLLSKPVDLEQLEAAVREACAA